MSAGSDRPMASVKAHLGCNDTRCTRTPRASVSSDWWKPRRQETDVKSTNLPGSRSTIRFERGERVGETPFRGVPLPVLRIDVHRCIALRMQLVARRANKHIAQHWWWWYRWRGTDALGCGRDGRGIMHFATMHADSDLSLFRDSLAENEDIYVKATSPNYI